MYDGLFSLHMPCMQTSFGYWLFAVAGWRSWNSLPDAVRDSSLSFLTFAKLLKSYLFRLVIFNWRLTNVLTNDSTS